MKKTAVAGIVIVAVAALATVLHQIRPWNHKLRLSAYVQDAQGLRAGAPVRVAGVDVGSVAHVRVRPANTEAPAEISMLLSTPYQLQLPSDSVVVLEKAGVLGETFVEIEIAGATAPAAKDGAVLKVRPTRLVSSEEFLDHIKQAVKATPCEDQILTVTPRSKEGQSAGGKSPR